MLGLSCPICRRWSLSPWEIFLCLLPEATDIPDLHAVGGASVQREHGISYYGLSNVLCIPYTWFP